MQTHNIAYADVNATQVIFCLHYVRNKNKAIVYINFARGVQSHP